MVELKKSEMDRIAYLFEGWEETMIWSCLQGCMGRAWVNETELAVDGTVVKKSTVGQIIVGDICFFAGEPDIELIHHIPEDFPSKVMIMVGRDERWNQAIETVHKGQVKKIERYAIKKEKDVFDQKKLMDNVAKLSPEYELRCIDEALYHHIMETPWAKYLCSSFPEYESFKRHGVGYVIVDQGKVLSGASTYAYYHGGIEIEIDTHKNYRRKGFALVCASKLILDCLDRHMYPSWDAANKASVALAEKLGYHFDHEYRAYEVPGPSQTNA